MYESIDFTVRDSKGSPEYKALMQFGHHFGIYPAHKTDVDHPHWHHFEFRPDQISKGSPKGHLPGYGSPRPRLRSAETTVAPGTVKALKPGIGQPSDDFKAATQPLAPYQQDPEAIRNLLQHQQTFARGRGVGPMANLGRVTRGMSSPRRVGPWRD